MHISTHFSHRKPVFHDIKVPEKGSIVGYASVINKLNLPMPMVKPISLICEHNKSYKSDDWLVLPSSYLPEDHSQLGEIQTLYKHLVFALKYEGINLLFFSCLIKHYSEAQLTRLVNIEPTGKYSRRIWFVVEWLLGKELKAKKNLNKKSYVPIVDTSLQYAVEGHKSPRHLVINNLPGTPEFCPMLKKTDKLEKYVNDDLFQQNNKYLKGVRKDIIQRASAFLLLKDSKASFSIEGESSKSKRAERWGKAIGQAGLKELNLKELLRLQDIVIENFRFIEKGFRKKGGFVGEHDRTTGQALPEHISAKSSDLTQLLKGLIETNKILINSKIDAVVVATVIAFGFVFIHPFEDGNGRIHRYLIHHVLAQKHFSQQGIIFPISASVLNHIENYRRTLESFSKPLLDFIEWEETEDHNINVLNDTIDYYRYFDCTVQAEFLYDCVLDTIENIIPQELSYIIAYDEFKNKIDKNFKMPDRLVSLLVNFLNQNNGILSNRAKKGEFSMLTQKEISFIEKLYEEIFE